MSSLVTDVLSSAGRLEKENLETKIGRLARQVDEIKLDVYSTLEQQFHAFFPSLTETKNLFSRLQTVGTEITSTRNYIENELQKEFDDSSLEIKDLSKQLQETNLMLKIVEKLAQTFDLFESLEGYLGGRQYLAAAKVLDILDCLFAESSHDCEGEIKILQVLKKESIVMRERLIHDLGERWSEHVIWTTTEEEQGLRKVVQLRVKVPSPEKSFELEEILKAMYHLRSLDLRLKVFCNRFLTMILKPVISASAKLKVIQEREIVGVEVETKVLKVSADDDKPAARPTPSVVYKMLTTIFDVMQNALFGVALTEEDIKPRVLLVNKVGTLIAKEFTTLLVKECLQPSVPSQSKDLDKYNNIIEETRAFHRFLRERGLVGVEGKDPLHCYTDNIDVIFCNKMCQSLLGRARELMKQDLHDVIQLTEETPSLNLLPGHKEIKIEQQDDADTLTSEQNLRPNTFRFPTCQISSSTKQLVDLGYELMLEATQSNPYIASQLIYSIRLMFELYLDVVPTYHKERMKILPQQSALFHTNCMYIAHHLMTLGHQYKEKLPEVLRNGLVTFVDIAVLVRYKGTEAFLAEMQEQKSQLTDLLREGGSFHNLSEGTSYLVAAESSIKKVMLKLNQLQAVWLHVLPMNVYCKTVGTLINTALDEVVTRVVHLEDIPEACAVHLLSMFGIITDKVPALFQDPNKESASPSAAHRYIKKWLRFKELMLVLGSSMKDILDRWADGKGPLAHEFTVEETKHLIRALFQNTERRAQVLSKIR